jgi:hypothetical protein
MKIKVLTFSNLTENSGLAQLKRSLARHGWDYDVITGTWYGFGTKIRSVADALPALFEQGYTHVLFTDAHDTYFLQGPDSLKRKIFAPNFGYISAEKACWPDAHRAKDYGYVPAPPSPWCYVNSGQYFIPIALMRQIVEENPVQYEDDDQRWFTSVFLSRKYPLLLDVNCKIFQSIAFHADGDFTIREKQFINTITRTQPIAAHGNGKTDMEWLYKL